MDFRWILAVNQGFQFKHGLNDVFTHYDLIPGLTRGFNGPVAEDNSLLEDC